MGVGEGSGEGKGAEQGLCDGTVDLINRDPNDINDHLKVNIQAADILFALKNNLKISSY